MRIPICWRPAWGDEIALRTELARTDMGNKADVGAAIARALTRKFADLPADALAEAIAIGLSQAPQINIPILSGHCEVAQQIAKRIGLPDEIRENLGQLYERWDGKGMPHGVAGEAVELPAGAHCHAGAGCDCTHRGLRPRSDEGHDRETCGRRL